MMRRVRAYAATCAVALACTISSPGWSAPPANEAESVADLMRQGAADFDKQRYEAAREKFLRAWEVEHHPVIAVSLADAELKLERFRDAAEHLDYYLANLPPELEHRRAAAEEKLAECRKHVGRLRIAASDAGAEISLDGEVIGKAPFDRSMWVEPGTHSLRIERNGRIAARQLTLGAGHDEAVSLALPSLAPAPMPPAPSTNIDSGDQVEAGPNYLPAIIGGSIAVVGIAAGIVFRLAGESDKDRGERLGKDIPGTSSCRGSSDPKCTELSDAWEAVDRKRNISTASFVVAGVSGLATAGYYLFWPKRTTAAQVLPAVTVASSGASLNVAGRF